MQMCQVPLSSTERKQAPKGAHWLHATELWRDSSSCFGFLPQRPLRVKGITAEVHRVPRLQSSHGPAWLGAEGQRLQATLDPGDVLLRSRCRAMSMTLQRYEVGVGETDLWGGFRLPSSCCSQSTLPRHWSPALQLPWASGGQQHSPSVVCLWPLLT